MKKILIAAALTLMGAVAAFAEPRLVPYDSLIGPTRTQANLVCLTTPTASQYDCLTQLIVAPSTGTVPTSFAVDLISLVTTNYAVAVGTNGVVNLSWPETNPWCATQGSMLCWSINPITPGVFETSYSGYVHK